MTAAAIIVFCISAVALAYTPFGYTVCLSLVARLVRRPEQREAIRPPVSLIVPVHNGATLIGAKIDNLRDLDYPRDLLEIIIVDDCSTDGTTELITADSPLNLYCLRLDRRLGKPAALNAGLELASGEVIGFTDAAAMLRPDALAAAVERFADPAVGCVSSEDVVVCSGGVGGGEGLYTRIDTRIRRLESAIASASGMSGSFYLVRRDLCPPFPRDLATDMFSALQCVDKGYRAIVEPRSKVELKTQADPGREFDRKVRTMVTGLRAISAFRRLLNPLRSGVFAWFLASHKLARYTTPLSVVLMLFSAAYLGPTSLFFRVVFAAEFAAVCIGTTQILMQGCALTSRLPGIPAFLCTTLAAAVAGWYQFLTGERYETWQPTERSAA